MSNSYRHKSAAKRGKQRQIEKGKMLHITSISPIVSKFLRKIRILILTHQPQALTDIVEPGHYEPCLLDSDVSGTEIPVPL
jgi:hypothetical protein